MAFATDTHGALQSVHETDLAGLKLFGQAAPRDVFGRLPETYLNDGAIQTSRTWDPLTGMMTGYQTDVIGGANARIEQVEYVYDQHKDLIERNDYFHGQFEKLGYDLLHRLTDQSVCLDYPCNLGSETEVTYSPIGNITNKSDIGDYIYSAQQPHAVSQAGAMSFDYDELGRQISRPGWPPVSG